MEKASRHKSENVYSASFTKFFQEAVLWVKQSSDSCTA